MIKLPFFHLLRLWVCGYMYIFMYTEPLELGSAQSLNHMFLILQLGADGHDDLANVNPGHCALGLPKSTKHTCLEPRSGTALCSETRVSTVRKLSPRSLEATHIDNRLHTLPKEAGIGNHCTPKSPMGTGVT